MSQENTSNADLWMRNMRKGAFEEAWKFSDAVLQARAGQPCWHLPRHLQYIWGGASLEGKQVLVRCYHGLGDTIQFIRYVPLLKKIAATVMVWVQPPLIPLLESVEGIDQLLPLHDGTPEVEYDIDIEVMELPHYFRTTLATIPSQIPYLCAAPMPLAKRAGQLSVGLVWKAGDWDERRSIPFPALYPLNKVEGIQLYILQAGAKALGWEESFGIHPGEHPLNDYARLVRSMDLVITVDSMPAHLAGALGVPVWNLLHAEADWRWMDHREDSPWYSTMRLYRQKVQGDWDEVIQRVVADLQLFFSHKEGAKLIAAVK